jgi:AraC-like DNA-binding protein
MDTKRKDLYLSRMITAPTTFGIDGWTFQLLSILRSHHAAEVQFRDAPQWNSDLHLIHTIAGKGLLHIGRQTFETTPDVVLSVPAFQHCRWEKIGNTPWTMLNVHARLYDADTTPLHEGPLLPIRFAPSGPRDMHDALANWHDDLASTSLVRRSVAGAGVLGLLSRYMEQFAQPIPVRNLDGKMQLVRERLQAQAQSGFDAGALASAVNLSVSQLNRRFRTSYEISPQAYWHRHRLSLAQSMLANTPTAIAEIADTLGFADVGYFSRWFRQKSSFPPSQFRRLHRAI